ncbi:hypothetical protein [Labrys neptuniae]
MRAVRRGLYRSAITLIALLIIVWSGSAFAGDRKNIGSWTLVSGKTQDGGIYCRVETSQGSKIFGLHTTSSGQSVMGIKNTLSTMFLADEVTVSVDGRIIWRQKSKSIAGFFVYLDLGTSPSPAPVDVLTKGKSLIIGAEGHMLTFTLDGFPQAADAQRACLLAPRRGRK